MEVELLALVVALQVLELLVLLVPLVLGCAGPEKGTSPTQLGPGTTRRAPRGARHSASWLVRQAGRRERAAGHESRHPLHCHRYQGGGEPPREGVA